MDRTTIVGTALAIAGMVGYVVGVYVPYPGRAFSTTAVMVGVTFVAIGEPADGAGR